MDRRIFLGGAVAATAMPIPARAQGGFAVTRSDVGLLMPAMLQGLAVKTLFDCGASRCCLDNKIAQTLGIAVVKPVKGQAAFGNFQAGFSDPVDLTIGDRSFHLPVIVMSLGNIGEDVGMIVGRDLLDQACLDLDWPNLRASFRAARPAPGMTPLDITLDNQTSIVADVRVEGVPARASLDSGNNTPLMIRKDWSDKTGVVRDHALAPWLSADLSAETSVAMTTLKDFAFGGADFRDIPAEVSRTQLRYEINLGFPVLERFHSFWDMSNGKLWLSATASDLTRPFERDRSGLACEPQGPVLKVVFVSPRSPGDMAGFKAGDEIAAVDGKAVATLSEADSLAWKHDPARTSVVLTMSSRESRKLLLKDYF
jgi:predicted aspartyl protease